MQGHPILKDCTSSDNQPRTALPEEEQTRPVATDPPDSRWPLVAGKIILSFLALTLLAAYNGDLLINSHRWLGSTDFYPLFISTVAFTQHQPMYGPKATFQVEYEDGSVVTLWNLNPPHLHLLVLPLASLSPSTAYLVWVGGGLACLALTLYLIWQQCGIRLAPENWLLPIIALLAFAGTGAALWTAHISYVLFLMVTLAWLAARRGRWGLVGLYLGLGIALKAFLLFLVPYLVLTRRWRALAGVAIAVGLCFGLGWLIFGSANYHDWRERLATADSWAWMPLNCSLLGMLSRTFTPNPLYAPLAQVSASTLTWLWLCLGVPLGLLTQGVVLLDLSPRGIDRAFALLLVGALLLSPLGWAYYYWLPLGPVLVLAASWWPTNVSLSDPPAPTSPWARGLLLAALPGLIYPVLHTNFGQPHSFMTLVIGNTYFWGALLVWTALFADALHYYRRQREQKSHSLLPLALNDYRISVVMPVFSETDTVRETVAWLAKNLDTRLLEVIIIIAPKSSQESRRVCDELAAQDSRVKVFVQQENPGVGQAFREGYARAKGNVVLSMDSDGEMDVYTIPQMLAEMARGNFGLVVASRWMSGGGFVGYSRWKYVLNWGFQQLFRLLLWTRIHDLTYGFKLLRAELIHQVEWEATLHEIGCETTLKPIRLGVSVSEVPTVWTARTQGKSTNNFLRNFRYVRMALRIMFRGVRIKSVKVAVEP
jgi:dolichol-phosphate mannosyltransferase